MKIIEINLNGKYAMFKKPYTNLQPQSFVIPPKTAIRGLIGAILGYDRKNYIDKLKNFKYSVILNNDVKKYSADINLMQGKNATFNYQTNPLRNKTNRGSRSPTRFEFIKNPNYNILISLEEEILKELEYRIKTQKFVFPVYLGHVNCFANIELITGITDIKTNTKENITYIDSFFEKNVKLEIIPEKRIKFYNELIPIEKEPYPITKEMVFIFGKYKIKNLKNINNIFIFNNKNYFFI